MVKNLLAKRPKPKRDVEVPESLLARLNYLQSMGIPARLKVCPYTRKAYVTYPAPVVPWVDEKAVSIYE